jgi:hypothetical protein
MTDDKNMLAARVQTGYQKITKEISLKDKLVREDIRNCGIRFAVSVKCFSGPNTGKNDDNYENNHHDTRPRNNTHA